MTHLNIIEPTDSVITELKNWLGKQDEIFPFTKDHHSSLLICYMLSKEMGTPNDDLIRYIYYADHNSKVNSDDLKIQIGKTKEFNGYIIRITCYSGHHLKITTPALQEIIVCQHGEIIISPEKIAAYIRSHGITPVIIKQWVEKILFSSFDLKKDVMRSQLWALRNNDVFIYSKIIARHQLVFQGTHDIISHIAGMNSEGMKYAATIANSYLINYIYTSEKMVKETFLRILFHF